MENSNSDFKSKRQGMLTEIPASQTEQPADSQEMLTKRDDYAWIDEAVRAVAELPDRNSPADWPEAMLVTAGELRVILIGYSPSTLPASERVTVLREALVRADSWISQHPHGDNCYVSAHYEGDPGNRCNCGRASLMEIIGDALAAVGPLTRGLVGDSTQPSPHSAGSNKANGR